MPPAGEHPDQTQAGPDLPDAAAGLAEVAVGDAVPLVGRRPGQHVLQAPAVTLALLAAPVLLDARPSQALGQVVAQRLERAEVEHAGRRDAGRRAVGDRVAGHVRGELEL